MPAKFDLATRVARVVFALVLIAVAAGPQSASGAGAPTTSTPQEAETTDPAAPGPGQSTADKALAVLKTYCAGCHQERPGGGRAPDRFGHVLNLDELARDPRLIEPARPDASAVYQRMLGRHAPLDIYTGISGGKGPAPQEIESIRDWIETLPRVPARESAIRSGPLAAVAPDSISTIALTLWTDKPTYVVGDLAMFSVSANVACHLTLISIDRDGQAVVLFPNDLEPDNRIAAGATLSVPGADAAYQLRFDRPGPETVVAICQRTRSRPEGIKIDYERQRFTILGDWRTFLKTSAEREAAAAQRTPRRSRTKTDGGSAVIDPGGRNIEGRTAITVIVEERATPRAN